MKKKIYIFVSFSTYDWSFETSVHDTIEEAREAQWQWFERCCKYLGIEKPTKDEMCDGENGNFYYNEDSEYMSISPLNACEDRYSTIEIKEINV